MNSLYYHGKTIELYAGDAIQVMKCAPNASADCIIASPQWGLRDYGRAPALGVTSGFRGDAA